MQNWFAVFVDFVIVVVGVFFGLQVQDWNDARKDRLEERALLNRLYTETQGLLDANNDELSALQERGNVLTGVNPVLFSQEPPRAFSLIECREIAMTHYYSRPPDELPVLDEMMETGKFDLLEDQAIKDNLRRYVMLRERARASYGEIINELFRLISRYPSLIAVRIVPATSVGDFTWGGLSGDGYRWVPGCDVEKMRGSAAFLNEYADNVNRLYALTGFVTQRRDHLIELERILAEEIADEHRQD